MLEVRQAVATPSWTTRNFRFDFDGVSLGTFDETWSHSGSAFGSRATNGRGVSAVLGGAFSNTQQLTLYSGQRGHLFTDVPDTIDWSVHDVVYNPERDEFALFWVGNPSGRLMMQTRFMDGGVGFTRSLTSTDFLAKPDAVAWTPGGYFLMGTRSIHAFAADGTQLQTAALSGAPYSVASNGAGVAGATMQSVDGGMLSFVKFESQTGSLSELPIRSGTFGSTSRIVWDPQLAQWHVVYQHGFSGPFWVASFSETGQRLRELAVGCNVTGVVNAAVLDGRFLFVGATNYGQRTSWLLRVELQ